MQQLQGPPVRFRIGLVMLNELVPHDDVHVSQQVEVVHRANETRDARGRDDRDAHPPLREARPQLGQPRTRTQRRIPVDQVVTVPSGAPFLAGHVDSVGSEKCRPLDFGRLADERSHVIVTRLVAKGGERAAVERHVQRLRIGNDAVEVKQRSGTISELELHPTPPKRPTRHETRPYSHVRGLRHTNSGARAQNRPSSHVIRLKNRLWG